MEMACNAALEDAGQTVTPGNAGRWALLSTMEQRQ